MDIDRIKEILLDNFPYVSWRVEEWEYAFVITAGIFDLKKATSIPKILIEDAVDPELPIFHIARQTRNEIIRFHAKTEL